MIDGDATERRPFFVCESCGVVYARLEGPQSCKLCDASMFSIVQPELFDA